MLDEVSPRKRRRGSAGVRCNNPLVAYNRRQPRRQGVRYGPPREKTRGENGVLIGRFLGLGILLLTVGLLAAGALAFIGDGPASPSAAARSSNSSPPPTSAPLSTLTPAPSNPPTAAPTASAVIPTPGATNPRPLVQIGEGHVTFGTRNDDGLRIVDPRSTFAIDERVVWSAYLTRRADSIELRIHVLKLDAAALGGERLILDQEVTPLVRNGQIFAHALRPEAMLDGTGVYVVRYLRGTDVLSEGFLEITAS